MYPKLNPSPPPPPFQSWVLRWVIAYQKRKNFPLSPLQAGATPPLQHEAGWSSPGTNRFLIQPKSIYSL